MKIEKLNNNSWRIRKTYQGKAYSVVVDYKPTQKEALELIAEKMNSSNPAERNTLAYYFRQYMDMKSNVLKSSTKRGYDKIIRGCPEWLSAMRLNDITANDIQKFVNDESNCKSAKTIKNECSFICSVIASYRPNFNAKVKFPTAEAKEPYIPTKEDVMAVLEFVKGTKYEIPIKLACYGLRLSEIGALTIDDFSDNKVHIHSALVQGQNNAMVLEKSNKTTKSTRYVDIDEGLYKQIIEQGYIYDGSLHTLHDVLERACKENGIQQFSMHKLRHFYASYLHDLGFSEAQIMAMGGWSTPNVMKTVYRHAMNKEKANQNIAKAIGNLF